MAGSSASPPVWRWFRALLADRVRVDMSGHFGDPPVEMGADELTAMGRSVLSGFAATQHATSNVLTTVDGRRSTATPPACG